MDKDTMDYLYGVRDLELARLTCARSVTDLDERIARLGVPQDFEEPVRAQARRKDPEKGEAFLAGGVVGLVVWFFIGAAFDDVIPFDSGDELLMFPIAAAIVGAIFVFLAGEQADKEAQEEQAKLDAKYKKAKAELAKRRSADVSRVRRERVKAEALRRQREVLVKKRRDTEALLASCYSKGALHGDYRNLPAVCSFIDYFEKGICDRFGGPTGAYARFETDVKLKGICTSVESIDRKMNAVIANQYSLNHALSQVDAHVATLGASMGRFADDCASSLRQVNDSVADSARYLARISADSAAARWSAEQARKELAFKRWLDNPHDFRRSL